MNTKVMQLCQSDSRRLEAITSFESRDQQKADTE